MKNKIIILSTVLSCLMLGGCGTRMKYKSPDIPTANLYRDYNDTVAVATGENFSTLAWDELFTDPNLQELIHKALSNNTDMRTAQLQVEQAEAALKSARLAFLPSFNLSPQGTVSSWDTGKANHTYSLPVIASWEIDVFGMISNSKKRSEAVHEQSMEYTQAVRTWLIATVSNTYYTLLMLDAQHEVSERTAESWKENVRVMKALKSAGMATEAAVAQAGANYMAVETSLFELRNQIYEIENTLCLLLAESPHSIQRGNIRDFTLEHDLTVGLPVQLLTNRPDVRMAELTLQQSFYSLGEAKEALWPSLTLSGSAGWTNEAGSMILNPGKFLAAAVGSVTAPIFNAGANKARVKIAESQLEETYLNFEQTVLNAGAEVINALKQIETASCKTSYRTEQIALLETAVISTELLMNHGNNTYLEVLTAQQALLNAELSQIADRFEMIQGTINLYHALGGGQQNWDEEKG
ncbi:MAG: TolC family protein [Rikenellaceae bacterium]|nr:TolC family protein [Rikenellaceae bacterium]